MNSIIKYILLLWLMLSTLIVWVSLMLVGFFFAFTRYGFMYNITPLIGLTMIICVVITSYRLSRTKPFDYLKEKLLKL